MTQFNGNEMARDTEGCVRFEFTSWAVFPNLTISLNKGWNLSGTCQVLFFLVTVKKNLDAEP